MKDIIFFAEKYRKYGLTLWHEKKRIIINHSKIRVEIEKRENDYLMYICKKNKETNEEVINDLKEIFEEFLGGY